MKSARIALLAGAGLAFASPAFAQQAVPPVAQDRPQNRDDDFHGTIVVTTGGLRQLDVLAGTSVMRGEELQRELNGQIGEVLNKLPGVSASSFAPGASRPLLRGFGGDRVRVMVDGLGTNDASNVSDDHAASIEPLTAERIEVLRGPAVLIYGGSAIGGAVNVIDKRIPLGVPDEPVHLDAAGALDTAYDLREAGVSIDVPLGSSVAFHLDGSHRRTGDLDVPGYLLSDALRADLLADAEEEAEEGHQDHADELIETANRRGTLLNSVTETTSLGAGLAWFGNGASLGASIGYYDTRYGVPAGAHHHEHEEDEEGEEEEAHEEEGPVAIGLEQWRADLRGAVDLGGFFEQARTRWSYTDYTHTEFEGDEVGTRFLVSGIEGRFELIQRERNGWRGSFGGQFVRREFEAIGEEAFVPPNTTSQYGLFALQEIERGPWELEFAGRYERTEVGLDAGGAERAFDALSGAVGVSHALGERLRMGLNLSRAQRAPNAEELFADGPHIATRQFEIGDPLLAKESAIGLEGYFRGEVGRAQLSASIYRNWFDNFVYLQATGDEEDGLPVYQQMQQGADHFGIEAEASVPLFEAAGFTWVGDLRASYVEATLADGSPVPRIPPVSALGALELQSARWDARAELEWYGKQDRIAAFESETDGFAFVNLSLVWKPMRGSENLTLMLQANNVFDAEGRRHASFTKDFVPLAGRNVRLSARLSL